VHGEKKEEDRGLTLGEEPLSVKWPCEKGKIQPGGHKIFSGRAGEVRKEELGEAREWGGENVIYLTGSHTPLS